MPEPYDLTEDTYRYRARAYHEAARNMAVAAEAMLVAQTERRFPDARSVQLEGEYNEDGELRVRVTQVVAGDVTHAEGDSETLDDLIEDVEEPLMYLAETTGEDYLGLWTIDIPTRDMRKVD